MKQLKNITKEMYTTTLPLAVALAFIFLSQPLFSQTNWFKVGSAPRRYDMLIDSINQYDGKNVTTLKSLDAGVTDFGCLMQNMKPGKYLGKRVRMTGYLKSKDIIGSAGFWFRVDQANSQQFLSFDNMQDRPIKGTTGWKKYEIVLDVPNESTNIAFGALFSGTGQIWIDNVHFEIVDNTVSITGQKKQESW